MTDRQALKLFGLAVEERPIRTITRIRAACKLYKGSAAVALMRFENAAYCVRRWGGPMTVIAGLISGLVQRQIERGFEPTHETDAYHSDWREGRAAQQRGERCPRWQTRAFKRGYREGR